MPTRDHRRATAQAIFLLKSKQNFLLAQVLQDAKWPDTLPYGADDFQRFDESSDSAFYSQV